MDNRTGYQSGKDRMFAALYRSARPVRFECYDEEIPNITKVIYDAGHFSPVDTNIRRNWGRSPHGHRRMRRRMGRPRAYSGGGGIYDWLGLTRGDTESAPRPRTICASISSPLDNVRDVQHFEQRPRSHNHTPTVSPSRAVPITVAHEPVSP
jgi:hypothetical protein